MIVLRLASSFVSFVICYVILCGTLINANIDSFIGFLEVVLGSIDSLQFFMLAIISLYQLQWRELIKLLFVSSIIAFVIFLNDDFKILNIDFFTILVNVHIIPLIAIIVAIFGSLIVYGLHGMCICPKELKTLSRWRIIPETVDELHVTTYEHIVSLNEKKPSTECSNCQKVFLSPDLVNLNTDNITHQTCSRSSNSYPFSSNLAGSFILIIVSIISIVYIIEEDLNRLRLSIWITYVLIFLCLARLLFRFHAEKFEVHEPSNFYDSFAIIFAYLIVFNIVQMFAAFTVILQEDITNFRRSFEEIVMIVNIYIYFIYFIAIIFFVFYSLFLRYQNERRVQQDAEATSLLEIKVENYITFRNARDLSKRDKEIHCAICYENYQTNSNIRVLPCSHYFHPDCVSLSFNSTVNKCPICKVTVNDQSVCP